MSDLRVIRGDDAAFDVVVFQSDGRTPQNVTGYSFVATVKRSLDDDDVDALWQGNFTPPIDANGITVISAEGGTLVIEIPASITELWTPEVLYWDIQATTADSRKRTIDRGRLTVVADVTRA